ncbi:hypothetical protein [Streptomyces ziwulingensis]|uniref:hypothetical protein n=1 Tax=Streptomyces ziwulingensis TaxID=1045501 RepID=UPI0031E70A39
MGLLTVRVRCFPAGRTGTALAVPSLFVTHNVREAVRLAERVVLPSRRGAVPGRGLLVRS